MTLAETIRENRPHLSAGSVRTYVSLIGSLARSLDTKIDSKDELVSKLDDIIKHIKDMDSRKRKTLLAAIITTLGDSNKKMVEKLRAFMMKDIQATNEEDKKQEMTDKEKDNWMSWDKVMGIYNSLKKEVAPLWKLDSLNKNQFSRLQDFVLLSMLILIPPRRALDLTELLHRGSGADTNYIDFKKCQAHWNVYKTAKKYAEQVSELPKELMTILKAWLKKNPNDHMFVASDMKTKLKPPQITNRLNNIFGRHLSVNMMRKIFISDNVLKNVPALNKLEDMAKQMGHTLETAMLKYKKVDAPEVEEKEEKQPEEKQKRKKKVSS
jgi:hypothetical protein